jgi:hypothetical protein
MPKPFLVDESDKRFEYICTMRRAIPEAKMKIRANQWKLEINNGK